MVHNALVVGFRIRTIQSCINMNLIMKTDAQRDVTRSLQGLLTELDSESILLIMQTSQRRVLVPFLPGTFASVTVLLR